VIRERFLAALGRDPALIVPTPDDAFAFERELCRHRGALLGGSVLVFKGLFGEVAKAAGEAAPGPLSDDQRIRLLRAAIEQVELGPLRASAKRPGFAAALDDLIGEFQAAGLSPESVAAGAFTLEGSAYLDDLTALYRAYGALRDSRGHADSHTIAAAAIAALRQDPDSWGGRPVLFYGFDDMTVEQRELVAALAAATEVTVSLTYEDRAALSDRARLFEQLKQLEPESETQTEVEPGNTTSAVLFHLERSFLREGATRVEPDSTLNLLRSAGDRGEAELIGAEIARLLADGERPDEIAVALRDPTGRGPLHARVLRGFGIPVALETKLGVAQSGTGSCLLALLRAAFGSGSAADLLAYLRGPRRAGSGRVDRLERAVRRGRLRTADEAAAEWEQRTGEPPRDLQRLRAAAGDPLRLLDEVASLARDIAQWPLATEESKGEVPGSNAAHELQVAERIAKAAEELAELQGMELGPEELIATLKALTMRAWTGPAEGRVRIASPYDLRASRFRHLFVGLAAGRGVPPPPLRQPLPLRRAARRPRAARACRDRSRGALPIPRLSIAANRAPLSVLPDQRRGRRRRAALAVRRRGAPAARPAGSGRPRAIGPGRGAADPHSRPRRGPLRPIAGSERARAGARAGCRERLGGRA